MGIGSFVKKATRQIKDATVDIATGGISNTIGAAAGALGVGKGGVSETTGLPEAGPSSAPFDEKAAALSYEQSQRQQRASAASAILSDNDADVLGSAPVGPKRRSASRAILG